GDTRRLLEGAEALDRIGVDAAMWACTSGSFVFGLDGAKEQAAVVERSLGVPVSSTSLAFADACRALGLRRVSIAATYPEDVAAMFRRLLADSGIETVQMGALGIITGAEVGTVGRDRVIEHALDYDDPTAEAVLLPDTALHTVEFLD